MPFSMSYYFDKSIVFFKKMAERVGFEPTDAFTSAVFKTAALSHSATSLKMEVPLGIEPRTTEYKSVILPIKLWNLKNVKEQLCLSVWQFISRSQEFF